MSTPSYSSNALCVQSPRIHPSDDLSYYLVFFNTFEELTLPITGQRPDGGRWGDQAVRTIPDTVSLRGSCRENGGQGPLIPLFLAGTTVT